MSEDQKKEWMIQICNNAFANDYDPGAIKKELWEISPEYSPNYDYREVLMKKREAHQRKKGAKRVYSWLLARISWLTFKLFPYYCGIFESLHDHAILFFLALLQKRQILTL